MARIKANIPTIKVGAPLEPTRYLFPLKPLALDRPRFSGGAYDTAKNRAYKQAIAEAAALSHPFSEPFAGDLRVFITFYFKTRAHGDIDNLIKAVLDGVQKTRKQEKGKWHSVPGVVMQDDKQVKALSAQIVYDKVGAERSEMIVDAYRDVDFVNSQLMADVDAAGLVTDSCEEF